MTQDVESRPVARSTRGDAEHEIRQIVAEAHVFQSQVDPLMSLHTADTVIVNVAGRRVLGRDVFRDAMQDALGTSLAKVHTTVDIEDIRFATPDVAIVSCYKYINDDRSPDDVAERALPPTSALTYVLVNEPTGWRIALAQTMPIVR
jgi:uncharacterized protein (TIGR02246 family)